MKMITPLLLAIFLFAGCVTQQVDWQTRIGNYTQDQAIKELGPPDKSTRIPDGSTVDEWITERRHVIEAPEPYFLPAGAHFGPATPTFTETYVPNDHLQLTFAADGKLKAWKKFMK